MAGALPVSLPGSPAERLAALFDTHQDRLYRLARRLAADSEAARDLVQETFLRAAHRPAAVPVGTREEEAWLVRVLVNVHRDRWRKDAVRKRHNRPPLDRPATGREEDALVARAAVWSALDRLRPRRRAVVVMHELEGLAVPAIASLLGISAVTVRWHLSRGRRELARLLAPAPGDIHENG